MAIHSADFTHPTDLHSKNKHQTPEAMRQAEKGWASAAGQRTGWVAVAPDMVEPVYYLPICALRASLAPALVLTQHPPVPTLHPRLSHLKVKSLATL